MVAILGVSAFYHDSAAALVVDGEIVAAVQEERLTRKKHDASFPINAIRACLREGTITVDELDYIAFYEKPLVHFDRLLETYLSFAPFLVVWMGDLPAGVSWYGPRVTGAWWMLATTIVLARFVVPFLVLLTDPMRRQPIVVLLIAVLLVLTEPLVLAWLILPSSSPARVSLRWTDLGLLALVVSLTTIVSWARMARVPLPAEDPTLARAASYRAR